MMTNFKKHIISNGTPITEAVNQLNQLTPTLTLFVVNQNNQLMGTLTDGDIRRGIVNGNTMDMKVENYMLTDFQYLVDGDIDVERIKNLKAFGIRLLPVVDKNNVIIKVYDLHRLNSVIPVDAVIMAGGRGERFRPLTDNTPKALLQIGNKPIIEQNIDALISYGIENIYISVNYLAQHIKTYLGDGSSKGINIQYIEENKPLGTAGSLSFLENKNLRQNILLTNSDLFTNINYEEFFLAYLEKHADMAIASIPYTVNIPYAILESEKDRITSFKEKPAYTFYANAGIYLLKKELLQFIPKGSFFNVTDLMNEAISKGKKVVHNTLIGYWIDIGKHEDLNKAQEIAKHIQT